jgi:hypothetical protein
VEQKAELAVIARTKLERQAAPPIVLKTDDQGNLQRVDTLPNGITVIGQKDDMVPFLTGPDTQTLGGLNELINQGITIGSLGPLLYQDKPFASGFDRNTALGTAEDMLYPFLRAMEYVRELRARRALQLFGLFGTQFGGGGIAVPQVNQQTGRKAAMFELQPAMVAQAQVKIKYRYKNITPQDQAGQAQIAALLAREKLASLDYVRKTYLGIKDTQLENTRVLADLIWMNPQVAQVGAQAAMAHSSDPTVQQVGQALMQQTIQGGQPPPGGPPGEQPPQPESGLPSSAVPDALGANAGAPPGEQLLGPAGSGPNPALDTIPQG